MRSLLISVLLMHVCANYAMEMAQMPQMSQGISLLHIPQDIMHNIAACSEPKDRNSCAKVCGYLKDCFGAVNWDGKQKHEILNYSPLKLGYQDRSFFMFYYCDEGNERVVRNLLENGAFA